MVTDTVGDVEKHRQLVGSNLRRGKVGLEAWELLQSTLYDHVVALKQESGEANSPVLQVSLGKRADVGFDVLRHILIVVFLGAEISITSSRADPHVHRPKNGAKQGSI